MKPYADHVVYARLLQEARPYWPHLAAIFALSPFSLPLGLLTLRDVAGSMLGIYRGERLVHTGVAAAAPPLLREKEKP